MPRLGVAYVCPSLPEDFPWVDNVVSWSMQTPWPRPWAVTELTLGWHWGGRQLLTTTPQFIHDCWKKHTEAWLWLEARHTLLQVPRFEIYGDGSPDASEAQQYSRVHAESKLLIGRARSSAGSKKSTGA